MHMVSTIVNFSYRIIALLILALSAVSCAVPPLEVHSSGGELVNPENYQSFSIERIGEGLSFSDHVEKGIATALESKGYSYSKEGGDLVVLYDLYIEEGDALKTESIPVNGVTYSRTTLEAVYDAKMLVNIKDRKAGKKAIWKASTTRDLRTVNTKVANQERINQRMSELFESFPAR